MAVNVNDQIRKLTPAGAGNWGLVRITQDSSRLEKRSGVLPSTLRKTTAHSHITAAQSDDMMPGRFSTVKQELNV